METPLNVVNGKQECSNKSMVGFTIPQTVSEEERNLYEKLMLYKAQIPQDLPKFLNFCWNTLAIRDFPLIANAFVKLEAAGIVNKISEINLETKTKPSVESVKGFGGIKQQVGEKTSEFIADAYELDMLSINEWMDVVKRTEIPDLNYDEKEIFQFIKVHKNVPQMFSHFHGYCLNYLKIEDKKLIIRIWRHLRLAAIDRAIKSKNLSENERIELEKLKAIILKQFAFNANKSPEVQAKEIKPVGQVKKKESHVAVTSNQQQQVVKILEVAKRDTQEQDKFHSISLELAENIMKLINVSLENAHAHIVKDIEKKPAKN